MLYVFQLQLSIIFLSSKYSFIYFLLYILFQYSSIRPYFATDLHPVDTDNESDYNGWINNNSSTLEYQ